MRKEVKEKTWNDLARAREKFDKTINDAKTKAKKEIVSDVKKIIERDSIQLQQAANGIGRDRMTLWTYFKEVEEIKTPEEPKDTLNTQGEETS
jgi:hypothetical protein